MVPEDHLLTESRNPRASGVDTATALELVELMNDVEVALAPLSPEEAGAMLRRLKVWPLLSGGFRGRPPLDVAAVISTLVKVGDLAATLGGRLSELDINPLLVGREGQGAIAADARAVIA